MLAISIEYELYSTNLQSDIKTSEWIIKIFRVKASTELKYKTTFNEIQFFNNGQLKALKFTVTIFDDDDDDGQLFRFHGYFYE